MAYMSIKYQSNIQISDHMYLYDLQMYVIPPSGHIKLKDLYQWCIDRLRVLKLVEQISRKNYKKSFRYCRAILVKELEENNIINFVKLINMSNDESSEFEKQFLRRNDCMTHFILRCAFSLERNKKHWFYKHEIKLFKWRLSFLNKEETRRFNYINGLHFPSMSEEEKQEIKEDLKIFCPTTKNVNRMNFYKEPFINVINLVAQRRVFLKDGIAYVPETKVFWIIVSKFKKNLIEGFTCSRRIVSDVYGDERITDLFSILRNCINKKHNKKKRVSINELDELSQTSYPLCMRLLHEALRRNHHLKNGGRVQYCLFLKGIGVRLSDTLQLLKDEFTKKIDEATFEREYKYFIRHLYGHEGRRANYEPFHCFKIFDLKLGLRDNHGCPFKCMAPDILKGTLSRYGLVYSDIKSIMQHSVKGSYLKGCKEYYEITHNYIIDKSFDHPNQYFNFSRKTKHMC